jgi:hypothetical protein
MTAPSKPGWYLDPEGGPKQRYWNGEQRYTSPPSAKLERRRAWQAEQQQRNRAQEQPAHSDAGAVLLSGAIGNDYRGIVVKVSTLGRNGEPCRNKGVAGTCRRHRHLPQRLLDLLQHHHD